MNDILAHIAAYKRDEVRTRRAAVDPVRLQHEAEAQGPPRGFRAALAASARPGRPALIAEVKKASPSRGVIRPDFEPGAIARAYAAGGAACLSVLTDAPSFMGSEAALRTARAAVALPVLRKDFLVDPWQVLESRAMGADAVLVIMALAAPDLAKALIDAARALSMDVLVEVHDETEIAAAVELGADLIGINNRDLRTFETSLAVTRRLSPLAPETALLVSESGIVTPEDVQEAARAGANAILVGESLMRQSDVTAAARALIGRDFSC